MDIVIELMGGYDLAKRVILDAVQRGKHVVTANKALLAVHGKRFSPPLRGKGSISGLRRVWVGHPGDPRALMEG